MNFTEPSKMSFVFEVIAKNPPMALFVLAALAFVTASVTNSPVDWTWVSNFFYAGIILQFGWIGLKIWQSRDD